MAKKALYKNQQFDDLFYKHGFFRTKLYPESRRRRFHNPFTIIIITSIVLFERIVSALYPKKSRLMRLIMSDNGHYFDMGWIWDVLIIILGFLTLSVHILFTINHKKGNAVIYFEHFS